MDRVTLLVAVLVFQFALTSRAFSQPMTFQEISMLLRNGEKADYVEGEAGRRKLQQALTPAQETTLTSLGATPALLNMLRAAASGASAGNTTNQSPAAAGANTPAGTPPSSAPVPASSLGSLSAARKEFATKLVKKVAMNQPVPTPPSEKFQIVTYHSPAGELSAYLSTSTPDGKRYPAIIWIAGLPGNGIGPVAWEPAPVENDQSASIFAKEGIITMFPSLRGGNTNPGYIENFYGEVDDVIAAAEFLSQQPNVDPHRIYLGGHSPGGTLVLLVAECSDRFRSVFAFGPVANAAVYGLDHMIFDTSNRKEIELRAPVLWLQCIRTPTFVFEGATKSNIAELNTMQARSTNPQVHFLPIGGATHYSVLAPLSKVVAEKILKDRDANSNITFPVGEKIE